MRNNNYEKAKDHEKREKVMDVLLGGKIPPQAVEMEEAVLGAILQVRDAMDLAMEVIKSPEPFYKDQHRMIYRACMDLKTKRNPIDLLTVVSKLKENGELEAVGGMYYITGLTSKVASAANIAYHSMVIMQKHIQRGRIIIAQNMLASAYDETTDPFKCVDDDRRALADLVPDSDGMVEASSLVKGVLDDAESAIRGESLSINCGFRDIDEEYAYEGGELCIIGAASGTGKTAFALQLAKRIHKLYKGVPVIFNTLEMKGKQVVSRDLASSVSVSQMRLRTGKGIGRQEIEQMLSMTGNYDGIYIVKCRTNDELALKVRQLRKQLGMTLEEKIVVVSDYAQIMRGEKGGNREQEVASISRSAKELAEDENVLYFLLSQMNKGAGKDRPTQLNLRESSGLGNDADWVMLLYSPSRNGETEYEDGTSTENTLEVIFDKVRFGKPGQIVKLHMSDYGLIGDMPSDEYDTELRLPKIQPNMMIHTGEPRHSDEQPTQENKGGGDFFPF